ncbi:MAG: amidohydrolase family protein [Sediminibacterium sp.]
MNSIKKCTLSVLVVLLSIINTQAQQAPITVIKAGKLIDVENGKVLTNQIIIVRHDSILQVGANISIPSGATIIDLSKYTVLPGLIDCHTHITGQPSGDFYADIFRKTPVDVAITAHLFAKKTLDAGFTTVRDLGSVGFVDVALRNAINNGDIAGPTILAATTYIGSTGSHGDLNGYSPFLQMNYGKGLSGIANGVDAVREQVRFNIKYGADVIKFGASAGVLSEEESVGGPQYSQEEMNAIVSETKMWGKKAAAHAHGTEAIKMAVKAGVASIEHGSLVDAEGIQLMKANGTYLVSDVYDDEYILAEYAKLGFPEKIINKERLVGRLQRENFQKAVEAGVKIAYGTDAGVYPHGWNGKQFKWMTRYGMTPMTAIQAATVNAADLLGISQNAGSITAGKKADIIAVLINPMEDVTSLENVQFVMKAGTVYKK